MSNENSGENTSVSNNTMRTAGGRPLQVIGDASLITLERFNEIGARLDSDPRIASVSLIAHDSTNNQPDKKGTFLRATAPAGAAIVIAQDATELAGDVEPTTDMAAWSRATSERGLWHDWVLSTDIAVRRAPVIAEPAPMDIEELTDPSGSHYRTFERPAPSDTITISIDVTWLGPHETGAQVLTTAAIDALARHPRVSAIRLFGAQELPEYARHVLDHPSVTLDQDTTSNDAALEDAPESEESPTDIVWFPNQIDQRSNIADARARGRRFITTYLDLIAYDIPRYHASQESWAAYRRLQRRIALTVDGITTISADVAKRLYQEVPRLETSRILPVPLGLDHITAADVPTEPPAEVQAIAQANKPFVLVLGNDFRHKNRDFAIKVWQQLLDRNISCDLVLAGLHVKGSSTHELEESLLATHVNLRGSVHTLGHVSHESRAWLLANAAAVLYPSSAEGFGFVPYEAAALGVPSTFARFGPLAELTGVTDVPAAWNVEAFANDLGLLLTDSAHRDARVTTMQQAIETQTWSAFANTLVDFFIKISQLPPVQTSVLGSDSTKDAAALAAVLNSKTWRVAQRLRRAMPGRS